MTLPGPLEERLPGAPYSKGTGWLLGSMSWVASRGSHMCLVKLNYISKCLKEVNIFNDKMNDSGK